MIPPNPGDIVRFNSGNVALTITQAKKMYLCIRKPSEAEGWKVGTTGDCMGWGEYVVICNIFDPDIDWSRFIP